MEPQSYLPADGDQQVATPRPHGKRRIAALVASTALVAGVGGAGIGYAATRGLEDRSATTSASGEGRSQGVPGSGWSFNTAAASTTCRCPPTRSVRVGMA